MISITRLREFLVETKTAINGINFTELIIDDSEISLFRKFVTEYKKYLQKNSSANLSIVINEEGDIIFKIERFTALEMFYLGIYMAQNGYKYEFVEFTNKNDEIPEGPQKR